MTSDDHHLAIPLSSSGLVPTIVDTTSFRNSVTIGGAFCLVFLAFSVAQNYQTSSDHDDVGSLALGILYACFTLTNFFASFVVSNLGPKICLVAGAATYVGFVATNIEFNAYALYAVSAMIGAGASVLWTSQGVYMTRCAAYHEAQNGLPEGSTMGQFNGLFWSCFQVNQLAGNLLVALLFQFNVADWKIFTILTAICGSGLLALTFLRDPYPGYELELNPTGARTHRNPLASLAMFKDYKLQLMIPMMIFSGLSQTWCFGEIPPLIESKSNKFYVMAAFGACNTLGSYVLGRLSDRIGRLRVVWLGALCFGSNIAFFFFWQSPDDDSMLWVFFISSFVLGIGDSVFNTQIYSILGVYYEKDAESAFANYKLFQAGSTAAAFLYRPYVGFRGKAVITFGFLFFGMLFAMVLYARAPFDKKESDAEARAPLVSSGSSSERGTKRDD